MRTPARPGHVAAKHVRGFQMFDIDEKYAPPTEPIVDITKIADVLHIEIARATDEHDKSTLRTVSQIAVDARTFKTMLDALYQLDAPPPRRRSTDR